MHLSVANVKKDATMIFNFEITMQETKQVKNLFSCEFCGFIEALPFDEILHVCRSLKAGNSLFWGIKASKKLIPYEL